MSSVLEKPRGDFLTPQDQQFYDWVVERELVDQERLGEGLAEYAQRRESGWKGRFSELFVEKGWIDAESVVRRLIDESSRLEDKGRKASVPPSRPSRPRLEGPRWKVGGKADLDRSCATDGTDAFSFCEQVLRRNWSSPQKVIECLAESLGGKPIDKVFIGRGVLSTGHLGKMNSSDRLSGSKPSAAKKEVESTKDSDRMPALLRGVREPLSRWSFILGMASIPLFLITAIPAIVLGWTALRRLSGERLSGRDRPLALSGILCAVVSILFWTVGGVLLLTRPEVTTFTETDRLLARAEAFQELGAYDEAAESIQTAVEASEDEKMKGKAYLQLALHYLTRGEQDLARVAFARAVACDPDVADRQSALTQPESD